MKKTPLQLFAGTASQVLGQQIAAHYGQPLAPLQVRRFSDGELYPQLGSDVSGAHVCLIQATYPPADHLMELLLTIDAAKRAGARCITLVIPYLGYMRQDRAHHAGGPIGAQLQAHLLAAAGADRLITCDLHAQQIASFFDFPVEQLASTAVFIPYIQSLHLSPLVFAAPDAGSVARAKQYAQHFGVPLVLGEKYKPAPNQVTAVQMQGEVQGADVILIDDIIDTGRTLFHAATQLKALGARTVRACCTHPVLTDNAYSRLANAGLAALVVTDTIPLPQAHPSIKVCSLAPCIAQALQQLA